MIDQDVSLSKYRQKNNLVVTLQGTFDDINLDCVGGLLTKV